MAVLWSSHHHLHSADAVSEWDYIDKDNGRGGYTGGRAAPTALSHIFIASDIPDRSFPIRTARLRLVSGYCLFRLMNIQLSGELPGKHFSARFPVLPVPGAAVSGSWL